MCNGTTANNSSQCYLLSASIEKVSITKVPDANQVVINFQLHPNNPTIMSNVNWTEVLADSGLSNTTSVSSVSFDPNTGQISLTLNYDQSLTGSTLNFTMNLTSAGPMFSLIPPQTVSLSMQTDDNQALEYYNPSTYKLAGVVKLLAMAIGALAFAMFIIAAIGGRLVGLEMVAVAQLAYLSLATI